MRNVSTDDRVRLLIAIPREESIITFWAVLWRLLTGNYSPKQGKKCPAPRLLSRMLVGLHFVYVISFKSKC